MKNHQLKALVQVAESGSIRAAARDMNLCQSALTKSLRELEEEVGVELLLRSYKGIEFTDAGHTLLTHARLALSILDRAQEEIALQGVRLSIAVTPLVGIQVLPQVLKEFERSHPAVRINLSEGLLTTPVIAAVAGRRDHPLAGAKTWDDIKNAKWVLNLTAGSQGNVLLNWLNQQGIGEPADTIRCDSPLLMLELMRRTDRLCLGPALLFSDPLIGQGIQRLDIQPLPPPIEMGLITLRGIPLSRSAKQLASTLVRHIRHLPPAC